MYYTREQQKRFLDKELTAISESYLAQLNTKATALLANNEVYIAQYIKVDATKPGAASDGVGTGQLMLRFKKDKGIPRKNEYFTAVLLEQNMCLPKNWGNLSWGQLRSHQVEFSEVHCVWQGKTDDKGFLLCGFSGTSLDMMAYLVENKLEGCVVALGPQEPPLDYYQNLIDIVSNKADTPAGKVLDFDRKKYDWNPQAINSNSDQATLLLKELSNGDNLVVQGPPGTGKTYLMAELVSQLLNKNKSVLVTALTNRALMELAEKESLKGLLADGRIMKTNVSVDEMRECKDLVPIDSKKINCMSGKATLTTFYNSSCWAKTSYMEQPFDYVIMDEASQSLFAMIAACKNLGNKVVWIGDQNQMRPIVLLSEDAIIRNDYSRLADGFGTLCDHLGFKSYILTETHRLMPEAARLTSLFYNVPIKSLSSQTYTFADGNIEFAPRDGGTKLVQYDMPKGEKADRSSCKHAIELISQIFTKYPKVKIAVLSKFRATVRMLQNCFIDKFGNSNNVLIDTVERVQGMTCDVCLYFIPNTMMGMSLDKSLFNVATSRATQFTVILADKSIVNANCDNAVRKYLESVCGLTEYEQPSIAEEKRTDENAKKVGVVVKGKIDLSKFETPKQKSVKSEVKKNIYIIDTNVFVDYPDILSKIDTKYQVVLSAKVIDELDKLKIKLDDDGKRNVEKALKNINRALDAPNVTMELSDISLLPADFSTKSPDNNILTVALKFKEENPILLTSDNGLQVKAKGLKLATISLREFLKH